MIMNERNMTICTKIIFSRGTTFFAYPLLNSDRRSKIERSSTIAGKILFTASYYDTVKYLFLSS
jgi:hypothetical protein